MSKFSIQLSSESFRIGTATNALGSIWIEIDNNFFPSEKWDDFPVIILGWWLKAFINLVSNKSKKEKFRFMDGPFLFYLENVEKRFFMRCIKTSLDKEELVNSTFLEQKEIAETLLSVSKRVLKLCNDNEYQNLDVKLLEKKAKKLSDILGIKR